MLPHSADIDLAARTMDDDFGPPIVDCINLGSFAEDDLPLRRASPKASPTYQKDRYHYRRSSPPPSYPPPPPSHHPGGGYYNSNSQSHYYSGYYPSQRYSSDQPWSSPPAYDYPPPPPPIRDENPSPPHKRLRYETPSKIPPPQRSPFRSPPPPESSSKKTPIYKRSPIWGGSGTPSIHAYGSFGMDTPGATMDEFSPIAPSFSGFNDEYVHPFDSESLHPKLSLTRSSSGDERDRSEPVIRQRKPSSTGYDYVEGISSPHARRPGSPGRGAYSYETSRYAEHPSSSATKQTPSSKRPAFTSPVASSRKKHTPSASPYHSQPPPQFASPYDHHPSQRRREYEHSQRSSYQRPPSHHEHPNHRSPYHHHAHPPEYESHRPDIYESQRPGPVRLELGDVASKPGETRKSLEGINKMVRDASTSSAARPHSSTPSSSSRPPSRSPHHPSTPHHARPPPLHVSASASRPHYPGRMMTPMKSSGAPHQGHPSSASRVTPANRTPHYVPPRSMSSKVPPSDRSARYPPPPQSSIGPSHGGSAKQGPLKTSPSSTAKENVTPAKGQRRGGCNCKKSRCLKVSIFIFIGDLNKKIH